MVKNKTLLLIAGIVWIFAGFNILIIGVLSYKGYINLLNLFYSFIIFIIFWFMIFKNLVIKHTGRIKRYKELKKYFRNFFDFPSFIIMAFMITVGISIRIFNVLPIFIIAIFYSGLGLALFLAGINFLINYFSYNLE